MLETWNILKIRSKKVVMGFIYSFYSRIKSGQIHYQKSVVIVKGLAWIKNSKKYSKSSYIESISWIDHFYFSKVDSSVFQKAGTFTFHFISPEFSICLLTGNLPW